MGHSIVRRGGRWSLAVGLGVALTFSACGGDEGRETAVTIMNFAYEPQELQVAPGTKVTWTNKDSATHTVQDLSELNRPISPDLLESYSFSITYEKPGSYAYNCGRHPFMTGTVKVA